MEDDSWCESSASTPTAGSREGGTKPTERQRRLLLPFLSRLPPGAPSNVNEAFTFTGSTGTAGSSQPTPTANTTPALLIGTPPGYIYPPLSILRDQLFQSNHMSAMLSHVTSASFPFDVIPARGEDASLSKKGGPSGHPIARLC